jgi:F-type H+-transporting ATPase subunit b
VSRFSDHLKGWGVVPSVVVASWLMPVSTWASSSQSWRGTYDLVMMWVNFFILLALLFKYLRKPVQVFFKGYRNSLEKELDGLEDRKRKAEADLSVFSQQLDARKAQAEAVRNRMIAQGERDRKEMIEDANRQSKLMIDSARQRIENRIREAGGALKSELIDAAVDLAVAQLPSEIKPEDDQKWVEKYLDALSKSSF